MKKFDKVYNTIMESMIDSPTLLGKDKLSERHKQSVESSVTKEFKTQAPTTEFRSMSNSGTKIKPIVGVRGPFKSKQDTVKVTGTIKPKENATELVKTTVPNQSSITKYDSKLQDHKEKGEMFQQAKQIIRNLEPATELKRTFKGLEKIK